MTDLNLTKEQQLILIGLIVSFFVGLGFLAWKHFSPSQNETISIGQPADSSFTEQSGVVIVHISGAVGREGVYQLKAGDRLLNALKLAGGATPLADLSNLNLAEVVKDGEKIIVPNKIRLIQQESSIKAGGITNLNSANEEQLDSLPGIGKSTAKQIIEYRQKIGGFVKVEQLLEIPRFGKGKLERLRDKVSL